MVDEYQDTNAIQLEIVYGLAGEQENIFIVGDPSQSIYGFRGSAPSTMTEFCKRFQRAKNIALETNYRSSQEIVTVINAIARKMKTGCERTLQSGSGHGGSKPLILEVPDAVAEATAIGAHIIGHNDQGGQLDANDGQNGRA